MANGICEESIFKSVFLKHSEGLRNFLYYKSKDLNLAEDLVQEAFAKLWEKCESVELEKAKSYLYTVSSNLFLNKVAHQKVVLKFEKAPHSEKDEQTPHFLLEEQEFKSKLEKAISDLPEKQRIVFLMNRIDQKKYREIAEELGISQKAVEKRMHLALSQLRKIHNNV